MPERTPAVRRATVAVVVLALLLVGCGWNDELPPSETMCDLGRGNDQGVAGHDLAASTELPDGRVLFVFGDTYLGSVKGDARTPRGLLNQSGAVLPPGADICSPELEYLTGPNGRVRPLLEPPAVKGTVFWPVDVTVVGDQVWMLYRWIAGQGNEALNFSVLATGLAVADADDLQFRRVGRWLVPDDSPSVPALATQGDRLIALSCTRVDGGCRTATVDPDGPVLRTSGASVGFGSAEMSLARVEIDGRTRWRTAGTPGLSCSLRVAVATSPQEHWEDDTTVFRPDVPRRTLCYAGRIQEAFSTADSLVATWVDSSDPVADADNYWPHVVRIDLS